MNRRVVITGVGCITPLGVAPDDVWKCLANGCSGAGPITLFDASTFPVRIAAEVDDWDLSQAVDAPPVWKQQTRQTQFALAAAIKASDAAGLEELHNPTRVGVFLGCGEIFPDFLQFAKTVAHSTCEQSFCRDRFVDLAIQSAQPYDESTMDPSMAASLVAGAVGAQGPNVNFTTACVSSSVALGEAMQSIRRGDADIMFSGGAHTMIHPFGVSGFHRLSTLTTRNDEPQRASRPFDRDRDGFVIGEGGIVFVLEELDHAKQRGAEIWCEFTGYGATNDAYRITDPGPQGRCAARCIQLAIDDAGVNTDEVDYINAHGSGTVANDQVETAAIKHVFGERAYDVPISGTKSMTGHLTTACGAIELLACLLALRHDAIPPTINLETPDPACDLDYVPNTARSVSCNHILTNSFGFGGQNVSLVISRF